MYTSMLEASTRDKNIKVSELKLTETCNLASLKAYMQWHEHVISIFKAYIRVYPTTTLIVVFTH